jgi:putative two-component system response regulator
MPIDRPDLEVPPVGRSRILIVDDEPAVRQLIELWLKSAGYECMQAGNVDSACEILDRMGFELVTSDIRMPGRSGLDLVDHVQARFPDTPILVLTAVDETSTAIQALMQGACGYLIKPFARADLLFQVGRALEHRRLVLENRRYMLHLEQRVREQTEDVRRAHEETIHRLVTASLFRDEETGAHVKRTGLFSEVLARAAGWSETDADSIRLAAPMHDIGKIGIPDGILCKPGSLTSEEFETMKRHTEIGARMLAGSAWSVLMMAAEIAKHHHERWDGAGYLDGLAGDSIPVSARIVSIVDVYDALTHDRVYRPAYSERQALEIMRQQRGKQFDPDLFDLCMESLPLLREIAREHPDSKSTDFRP